MRQIPEVGDRVTISMKTLRDRSYSDNIWDVIAVNQTHAQLNAVRPRGPLPNKIIVVLDEYVFSDASNFSLEDSIC